MQSPPNHPKAGSSANSTNSPTVISALPISVQGMQDSVELANMSIGQLLGHGQRRVSVTQVATVAPVSGGIQIIRPLQGGGITMSQAQQQTAGSPAEGSPAGRPIVQVRVEGNRILSTPDLRHSSDTKMTFITPNGMPLSRTSVTSTQQVRRVSSDCGRVSSMVKPSTPVLVETSDANIANTGTLLERARLDDLMKQIDPTAVLEDPAKDALLEFMDDFVEEVIERTCQVSQHRGSEVIEAKDVEYVLDKYFKIPRFPKGNGVAELLKNENEGPYAEKRSRRADFTAHNQRLSVINKTIKKI